jgi:hypothetical protein
LLVLGTKGDIMDITTEYFWLGFAIAPAVMTVILGVIAIILVGIESIFNRE